jgi:hypothetical protein
MIITFNAYIVESHIYNHHKDILIIQIAYASTMDIGKKQFQQEFFYIMNAFFVVHNNLIFKFYKDRFN